MRENWARGRVERKLAFLPTGWIKKILDFMGDIRKTRHPPYHIPRETSLFHCAQGSSLFTILSSKLFTEWLCVYSFRSLNQHCEEGKVNLTISIQQMGKPRPM